MLFLAGLSACRKDISLLEVKNLNNNKISVIGHGGMGNLYRYPMNSMESLNKVMSLNTAGTEMDLQLSKDKQLVLFHPFNLEDGTNLKGLIRQKTWEELKNARYSHPILSKSKLIRAVDFFNQAKWSSQSIFVFDCKVEALEDDDFLADYSEALYDLIRNYQLAQNCFIESYNLRFLQLTQSKNSALKLFVHADDLQSCVDLMPFVNVYGLTIDREKISLEEIEKAHRLNLRIALYNLDSESENREAVQMNPDYLQSDKIEYLLGVLKE